MPHVHHISSHFTYLHSYLRLHLGCSHIKQNNANARERKIFLALSFSIFTHLYHPFRLHLRLHLSIPALISVVNLHGCSTRLGEGRNHIFWLSSCSRLVLVWSWTVLIRHSMFFYPELSGRVEKVEALSAALLELPPSHYETLKYLLGHLYRYVHALIGSSDLILRYGQLYACSLSDCSNCTILLPRIQLF